ncbi:class I SAM-dependent methyltransferase [Aliiruegeria sabulilitoris]|uniref:class I SAM-dependent methyltransferase n=1 Tax=Aliiruegeria sabulilitoris TaxID=1510458 RepID=UPI0012E3A3EB|nr:class I SAM-dependent methyltransferase [Aliiruegeria sabulilitoris]NDR59657.1 class I SAM-dependent methyltransferase [Pseudoruegeria sp. M32A2M]
MTTDDYNSGRDGVSLPECPGHFCLTRERALVDTLRSIFSESEIAELTSHEVAPLGLAFSKFLQEKTKNYIASGFFPDSPFGEMVGDLRNENAEEQTFEDETFDLVVHIDVLEHVFRPFDTIAECYRTLRPGGVCLFTTPIYEMPNSEQVAFLQSDGQVSIVGEPEYHGNPQDENGSLVTWRYGYDLPLLIYRATNLETEIRRFYRPSIGVFGPMTEVAIIRKPGPEPVSLDIQPADEQTGLYQRLRKYWCARADSRIVDDVKKSKQAGS